MRYVSSSSLYPVSHSFSWWFWISVSLRLVSLLFLLTLLWAAFENDFFLACVRFFPWPVTPLTLRARSDSFLVPPRWRPTTIKVPNRHHTVIKVPNRHGTSIKVPNRHGTSNKVPKRHGTSVKVPNTHGRSIKVPNTHTAPVLRWQTDTAPVLRCQEGIISAWVWVCQGVKGSRCQSAIAQTHCWWAIQDFVFVFVYSFFDWIPDVVSHLLVGPLWTVGQICFWRRFWIRYMRRC